MLQALLRASLRARRAIALPFRPLQFSNDVAGGGKPLPPSGKFTFPKSGNNFSGERVWGKWAALAGGGILAASTVVSVIPAGNVGLVDIFGTVGHDVLHPGIHLVNPLANIRIFSIQTRNITQDVTVPTKEGLNVKLTITVLYRLDPKHVRDVFVTVGKSYQDVVLIPQARSTLRDIVATHEAKALYTSGRAIIGSQVLRKLNEQLNNRGIIVEDTLMKDIALPVNISRAIETKLAMEQESERMRFVLLKEKQEAERKSIEAQGIADFQRIVSTGINKDLLLWKGIEATSELAKSSNAKIVVVGNPKDGLPVILGGMK